MKKWFISKKENQHVAANGLSIPFFICTFIWIYLKADYHILSGTMGCLFTLLAILYGGNAIHEGKLPKSRWWLLSVIILMGLCNAAYHLFVIDSSIISMIILMLALLIIWIAMIRLIIRLIRFMRNGNMNIEPDTGDYVYELGLRIICMTFSIPLLVILLHAFPK